MSLSTQSEAHSKFSVILCKNLYLQLVLKPKQINWGFKYLTERISPACGSNSGSSSITPQILQSIYKCDKHAVSCLIALAENSRTMSHTNVESRYLCFVLILGRNSIFFQEESQLQFFFYRCLKLRKFPSVQCLCGRTSV